MLLALLVFAGCSGEQTATPTTASPGTDAGSETAAVSPESTETVMEEPATAASPEVTAGAASSELAPLELEKDELKFGFIKSGYNASLYLSSNPVFLELKPRNG